MKRQKGLRCIWSIFVILSVLVRYIGTRWIDKLFPPAAMGAIVAIISA